MFKEGEGIMKRFIICAGLLILAGCASEGPVKNIIRDQQFADYQGTLDQLEHEYLHKKISYADYLEKKKRVEEQYQRQVETRREMIENAAPDRAGTEMGK